MKRIAILGSTGSIGTNTIQVIEALGNRFQIVGLAAGKNTVLLSQQAEKFKPSWVYAEDKEALQKQSLPDNTRIISSHAELCQAVAADDVDIVLCAIVGTAGLKPVLSAIHAGKDIALASKEILVMAGAIVTAAAKASGSKLLPVDSEHCAIFQCIDGKPSSQVKRIILTCSGGPFSSKPDMDLSKVTLAQTLKHPTWNMGRKITIDSATLMNKGLEIIEAGWLFNMPEPQVHVVIHPQSIIHSMVEFQDNSILAQMGYPDMKLPIHYCLNYPERIPGTAVSMDFMKCLEMTFLPPDAKRFPALRLARQAMRAGGPSGAIFNAANEIAVQRFIDGTLTFDRIPCLVEEALTRLTGLPSANLDEIIDADRKTRELCESLN